MEVDKVEAHRCTIFLCQRDHLEGRLTNKVADEVSDMVVDVEVNKVSDMVV